MQSLLCNVAGAADIIKDVNIVIIVWHVFLSSMYLNNCENNQPIMVYNQVYDS